VPASIFTQRTNIFTQRQIQILQDNGPQDMAGFHNSGPFDPDPDKWWAVRYQFLGRKPDVFSLFQLGHKSGCTLTMMPNNSIEKLSVFQLYKIEWKYEVGWLIMNRMGDKLQQALS
jgi:hypothetical protein